MPKNYSSYLGRHPHNHLMRQANKCSADCIIAIPHPTDHIHTVAIMVNAITCIINTIVGLSRNSGGNRHCPNCGSLKKEQWIEDLTADLLPTGYYHVVFTLPHELHPIILGNRKALFKLLFDASSQTLLQFAKDPQWLGGKCSITMVLHTWGQQLSFHLVHADRVVVYFFVKKILQIPYRSTCALHCKRWRYR